MKHERNLIYVKLMKHVSAAICTDLQRLQIFTDPSKDHQVTITYSELPEITKSTPTNHVPELQHFISTSTNPEGCHMSNFIRQNEVNIANQPLKVQQLALASYVKWINDGV